MKASISTRVLLFVNCSFVRDQRISVILNVENATFVNAIVGSVWAIAILIAVPFLHVAIMR